jgi:hypothetical protein|tara:strand:+ start:235 stop:399 length:165 start_codon:yes stop_codon:yes gene_type:complete
MKSEKKPQADSLAGLLKVPEIPEMSKYKKTWAWKKQQTVGKQKFWSHGVRKNVK